MGGACCAGMVGPDRFLEQGASLQWLLDNPDHKPSEEDRLAALSKVCQQSAAASSYIILIMVASVSCSCIWS